MRSRAALELPLKCPKLTALQDLGSPPKGHSGIHVTKHHKVFWEVFDH